jgi:ankyrin repeat protein
MSTRTLATTALLLALGGCAPSGPRDITPLAQAARDNDDRLIQSLAAGGQDVNRADHGGNHWTPLQHAIHKGRQRAVDALIALGADVNRGVPSPLMMAVGNGRPGIVRSLLTAGADPRRNGSLLFSTAVSGGALTDIDHPLLGRCNTEVVRALVERDPSLRLERNPRGHLALWFARFNHCTEVIKLAKAG